MAVKSYFFDAVQSGGVYDRVYSSSDFVSYLAQLVGNGVFPNPSTQLQVVAKSGMTCTVKAGSAWIQGHKLELTADEDITFDAAHATLKRIDIVVAYMDTTTRACGVAIIKGTPASVPSVPTLTRTATRYELQLAKVLVTEGATAITQPRITDTRADSSLCGFVAGLIQQVDTSALFTQYETAFSDMAALMQAYYTGQQTAFDAWMAQLTQDLAVGSYVKAYDWTDALAFGVNNEIELTADGYTYEASDVVTVYINGLLAELGTDYTIDDSDTPVKVFFLASASDTTDICHVHILKAILGVPGNKGGQNITPLSIQDALNSGNTIEEVEEE